MPRKSTQVDPSTPRIGQFSDYHEYLKDKYKVDDVLDEDLYIHEWEKVQGTKGNTPYLEITVSREVDGEQFLVTCGGKTVMAQLQAIARNREITLPILGTFHKMGSAFYLD